MHDREAFWKQFPPIPGFDCVKMKHDIQAQIYEETKHMTAEERWAFIEREAAAFRASRGLTVAAQTAPDGEEKKA